MATIRCHSCKKDNPAGRGFCQFCGSRLVLPSAASVSADFASIPLSTDPAEVLRLKEALDASGRTVTALKQELEAAKQKPIADALRDSEQRLSEETRLKESLAESTRTVATLRNELEAAGSQSAQQNPLEQRLKVSLTAAEQMIASLKRDLEGAKEKAAAEAARDAEARIAEETRLKNHLTASTQTVAELKKELEAACSKVADAATQARHGLKEGLAAGERTIVALKQELEGVTQSLTADHKQQLVHKDTLIDDLKKKLQSLAELEKKFQTSVIGALPANGSERREASGTANRRQFGAVAMSVIAMLFAGAGGVSGYFFHGSDGQSATVSDLHSKLNASDGLNHRLQDSLRELHEANDRLGKDLTTAQAQLNVRPTDPGAGPSDDVQRQSTEAQATNKDLQQKLTATGAELDQRKQQMAAQEQTIARLNQELQDAKSKEANAQDTRPQDKPRESKPRPGRASDFESTIRNLQREYGREFGIPGNGR
jgi:chromosome segregation ATPase